MEDRKLYLWRVGHSVHGQIEVEASDRYFAVTAAAHDWGIRWSTIARDCRVEQLGEVSHKEKKKEENRRGEADKKKQRHH